MGVGVLPRDDNGVAVLGLWDDATGKPIPAHIGAKVTGADGNSYAKLDVDVTVSVDPANPQRVNAQSGDFVAGSISDLTTLPASLTELLTDMDNLALIKSDLDQIVPGVQGWIAATGTGTASQDDTLTFAQQVRKVALYNASANNVPLEFDAVSAATSFPIQPGASWIIDDVLCTTIHVFPSATLPINAANGLYVKGWK